MLGIRLMLWRRREPEETTVEEWMLHWVRSALRALRDAEEHRLQNVAAADIRPGQCYCRARSTDVLETARVARVEPVGTGVPHVRYSVTIRDHKTTFEDGPRTLGAASFLRLYGKGLEQVARD